MLALPAPNTEGTELCLPDSQFEDSSTIRLFLELMSATRNFNIYQSLTGSFASTSRQLGRLVHFMDKYNSERGMALLRLSCTEAILLEYAQPPLLFLLASVMNDLTLCFRIIKTYSSWTWNDPDRSKLLGPQPTSASKSPPVFLASHASLTYACSVPFQYYWALLRASVYFDPKGENEKFAHKFVEIVQAVFQQGTGMFSPRMVSDVT